MAQSTGRPDKDWAGNVRAYFSAWGIPSLAIIAGAFVDEITRTVIWVLALIWMGSACLMNARRCQRTHCRFTGPFYLLLTIPVLLMGVGVISFGQYEWIAMGALILLGGKVIWWATESAWGKFSTSR